MIAIEPLRLLGLILSIVGISFILALQISIAPHNQLDKYYWKYADKYPYVHRHLLKAIAYVESGEYITGVNMSDPSFGLMQIYCKPDSKGRCKNKFPALPFWEKVTVKKLLNPKKNIKIGAAILNWNIKHYGFKKGIAVYNCWSSRHDPKDGPFRNQQYVDAVLKKYKSLRILNNRRLKDEQQKGNS